MQVDYPGVTITGREEDGQVLFSQEQYVSGIPAGETRFFGFQAGNGTAPAEVAPTARCLRGSAAPAGAGTCAR